MGALFSGIWAKVIAAGAIFLAVVAFLAKVFSLGKQSAVAEGQKTQLENVEKRHEVDTQVDALKPDAARAELLRDWSKP